MKSFSKILEAAKPANNTQSDETWELRQAKNKLVNKLRQLKNKGADPAEIARVEAELEKAQEAYKQAKLGDKVNSTDFVQAAIAKVENTTGAKINPTTKTRAKKIFDDIQNELSKYPDIASEVSEKNLEPTDPTAELDAYANAIEKHNQRLADRIWGLIQELRNTLMTHSLGKYGQKNNAQNQPKPNPNGSSGGKDNSQDGDGDDEGDGGQGGQDDQNSKPGKQGKNTKGKGGNDSQNGNQPDDGNSDGGSEGEPGDGGGSGGGSGSGKGKSKPNPNSDDYKRGYEAAKKAIEDAKKRGKGVGGAQPTRDDPKDYGDGKKHGRVRPEDCQDPSGRLGKVPSIPGGCVPKGVGDEIAKKEGYPADGGDNGKIEKEWKERAQKAAQKIAGKGQGWERFAAKLANIYKVSKNWKKELMNIVGHAISPEDKRRGYTSNNILISQDRIALTDKQKFNNLSYMMVCIDTSGSMTHKFLEDCLRNVYHVALSKKPIKLVIVQFDDGVRRIDEYTSVEKLAKDIKNFPMDGGGGTNVAPCFDLLKNDKRYNRQQCELFMVFTDGYLSQVKRDPRRMRNLCWVVIDNMAFNLEYKDAQTKLVLLKSEDLS